LVRITREDSGFLKFERAPEIRGKVGKITRINLPVVRRKVLPAAGKTSETLPGKGSRTRAKPPVREAAAGKCPSVSGQKIRPQGPCHPGANPGAEAGNVTGMILK
jgi:hypothetical protein